MTEGIEKLLTVEDVMGVLRISRPTLYRLLKAGRLQPVRIGKRTLFDPGDIRAFIDGSKGESEPAKVVRKQRRKTAGVKERKKRTDKEEQPKDPEPVQEKKEPDPERQGRLL